MTVYHDMDALQLKAAYDNKAAVANYSAVLTGMQARSETLYKQHLDGRKDIAYGVGKHSRLDYLPGSKGKAPLLIFLHGGYWQEGQKEDVAFIARGPLSLGWHVILLDYALTPEVSMAQIVAKIGQALDYISANAEQFQIESGKVCLAGHNSGGQLAALHRNHPLVSSTMLISPLVDLEPIRCSWLNETLALSEDDVKAYSPIHHVGQGTPTEIFVGADELPELLRHSREYFAALEACGQTVHLTEAVGHIHFTLLDELSSSSGQMVSVLQDLFS